MLKGFIFFENGAVQTVGSISNYDHIISSMEIVLNRLKTDLEDRRRLGQYTSDDLRKELERRNEV